MTLARKLPTCPGSQGGIGIGPGWRSEDIQMFRDLLVHVDGSDAGRRRVQFAVSLANRIEARLNGLHVTPPVDVPVQFKPSRVNQIASEISASLALDAGSSAAIFKNEVEHRLPDSSWSDGTGDVVDGVCEKARYADLVILGQYESQGRPEHHPLPIAHSVVSRCGRPVLVVPGTASASTLTKVAVVWDRSREAIRTIHDALPLLRLSGSVQIINVKPKSDAGNEMDTKSLLLHLSNHGVQVDADVVQVAEHAALRTTIEDGNYDLLVVAGSANPPWVNFLFGDVTQSILLSSTMPVFVSR
jgi:nucleotide-binding universal stress UspA family protein